MSERTLVRTLDDTDGWKTLMTRMTVRPLYVYVYPCYNPYNKDLCNTAIIPTILTQRGLVLY